MDVTQPTSRRRARRVWLWFVPFHLLVLCTVLSAFGTVLWCQPPSRSLRIGVMAGKVIVDRDVAPTWTIYKPPPPFSVSGIPLDASGKMTKTWLVSFSIQYAQIPSVLPVITSNYVHVPLVYLALLAGLVPASIWFYTRRRPEPWECQKCCYDLRGLGPLERCPECGRKVGAKVAT